MLDSETKRRIDSARDILVGKVPDPKSQVEQITIALIYKFMDDMDAEAEELGGKRKFFTGDFSRYGWAKLMNAGIGGHELIGLYGEGISSMPQNDGIPALFRNIFKNAYLPYRDPETLKSFLKVIDEFSYDDSESLGDAFEYLLSVLGSQGDAGQFRTPRHIIDFIVDVIVPKKGEVILDPACGTAGFLISSYKHILRDNVDSNNNSTLTPDEKGRLAQNFKGYDISPDMVRLSLVNMYLHGFTDPHVFEYDTLTSEERWNEFADVILANPPFMSPKGGIKPHKRFSIQAKRSEVLFVDYIAEHLTPTGRAGIIVPEGIIFQSQTAYKDLRKMLVENSLVAVISLPAGVFNPYSGVKTSILILDKFIAKQSNSIAFFKIENDGFTLGAQRRANAGGQLSQVKIELAEYLQTIKKQHSINNLQLILGLIVQKEKIAANGDYNLSGERYRESETRQSVFPLRRFEEVCTLEYGSSLPKEKRVDGPYPVVGSNGVTGYHSEYFIEGPAIIIGRKGSAGEVTFIKENCYPIDTTYYVKQINPNESNIKYLYWLLKTLNLPNLRGGAGIPGLNRNDVYETHQIPLPPLEMQKEIVAELEGYQNVINGACAVIDAYRPSIPINPDWPMVAIENLVCDTQNSIKAGPFGSALKKEFYVSSGYKIYGQEQVIRGDAKFGNYYINEEKFRELKNCKVQADDVLISLVGTYGKTLIVPKNHEPGIINPRLLKLTLNPNKITPTFFVAAFAQDSVMSQVHNISYGGTMGILSLKVLKKLCLPLPPLETQQKIIVEIEAEQALINANRELIICFERKMQAAFARIWGKENKPSLDLKE
jgi:type I restriction enzyme M protein